MASNASMNFGDAALAQLGRTRTASSHVSAPKRLQAAATLIQKRVRGTSVRKSERRRRSIGQALTVARGGIVCGDFFMAALCEDRRGQALIFTWGFGGCGALGHGDLQDRHAPTLVQTLRAKDVRSVSAGAGHMAVVVRQRKIGVRMVYSWGAGASGQLGHGALASPQTRAPGGGGERKNSSASASSGHNNNKPKGAGKALARRASDLDLFDDEEEQEVADAPTEVVRAPRLVESLNDKNVQVVSCGDFHTAALTADGKVFVFGCNRWFQLGLPGRSVPLKLWSPRETPVAVRGIGQRRVGAVVCGGRHTLVVLRQEGGREASDVGSTISHMFGFDS